MMAKRTESFGQRPALRRI